MTFGFFCQSYAQSVGFEKGMEESFAIDADYTDSGYDVRNYDQFNVPFELGLTEGAHLLEIGVGGPYLWHSSQFDSLSHELNFSDYSSNDYDYPKIVRRLDLDTNNKEVTALFENVQLLSWEGQSTSLFYQMNEAGATCISFGENNFASDHPWNNAVLNLSFLAEFEQVFLGYTIHGDPENPELFKVDENTILDSEELRLAKYPEANTKYCFIPDRHSSTKEHEADYSLFINRQVDYVEVRLINVENVLEMVILDLDGKVLKTVNPNSQTPFVMTREEGYVPGKQLIRVSFKNGELVSKRL